MVNTFEYPVIAQRLSDVFGNDETVTLIAKVINGLIGKSVKDIDDRTKHLVKVIDFHFDKPSGRIVKIENRLDKIEGMLEAISKELDIDEDETRLDRIETQLDEVKGKLDTLIDTGRYPKRRRKM